MYVKLTDIKIYIPIYVHIYQPFLALRTIIFYNKYFVMPSLLLQNQNSR